MYYHTSYQDPTLKVVLVLHGPRYLAFVMSLLLIENENNGFGAAINAYQFREKLSRGSTDGI